MNLIKAALHGYRRFSEKTTMNLDGKLIAILGPNEAGKSSFLRALQHLNDNTQFVVEGGSQELSRGKNIPESQKIVEATFLLDENDLRLLEHIEDAKKVRWITINKRPSGAFYVSLLPLPTRNLDQRKKLIKSLHLAINDIDSNSNENENFSEYKEEIETVINVIDTDEEQLNSSDIDKIRGLGSKLLSSGIAAQIESLQNLAKELDLLAQEEVETPEAKARHILFNHRPKILIFDREVRDLKPQYDLNEVNENIPPALVNLLLLAEINFKELFDAVNRQDEGQVETYTVRANKNLEAIFKQSWSQSKVTVRLKISGKILHVLIDESERDYHTIAERSDGLRQYVALLLFLALEKTSQPPVLLIDEAETHLHYDAQADLVQMLARQEVASKVIYTTHSIGCLPEDLGAGVRLINPNTPNTSIIHNWFWEGAQPGFSPLLFGMGAKTLAFLPVRYALITEGATDIILLPSLLREATERTYLGFQIVPGISESDEERIATLEHGAPRTTYLTDGDQAGSVLVKQLKKAGISKSRIFSLPGNDVVIEDFVDAKIYVEAVNEELRRSHGETHVFPESELSKSNRPKKIEEWCHTRGIPTPSKRSVAYRIIEAKENNQILSKTRGKSLVDLFSKIEVELGINKT